MSKISILSIAAAGLLPGLVLAAAESAGSDPDSVDASALYQQNCTNCHGPEIYTRADRRIESLEALHTQVRMCDQNLELRWFDDQIDAVADLLNRKYYNFGD